MESSEIEKIVFNEVGYSAYSLKKVEIVSPMQNIAGLIMIGKYYYKKVHKPLYGAGFQTLANNEKATFGIW